MALLFGGLLASLVGAMAGWWVRGYRMATTVTTVSGRTWNLEDFVHARSFSLVEVARAELAGLAQLYRSEARVRLLQGAVTPVSGDARWMEMLADLERACREFRDTPGEAPVLQDYLLLLRRTAAHDRWLDAYLDFAYRRPTEEVIGLFAHDAVDIAARVGRESEVAAVLRHVLEIPLEFPGKLQITLPLVRLNPHDLPSSVL